MVISFVYFINPELKKPAIQCRADSNKGFVLQGLAAIISQPRKGVNVTILKRIKIPNETNTIRQYCQFEPVRLLLEGFLPSNKEKLVKAWIEIHQEDLMANWQLAVSGNKVYNIDPLE